MDYIRSPEDLHNQALEDVPPICGKGERMLSHLRKCPDVAPDVRAFIQACAKNKGSTVRLSRNQQIARAAVNAPAQLDIKLTTRTPFPASRVNSIIAPSTPRRNTGGQFVSTLSPHNPGRLRNMWDTLRQEEFAQDLCKLFISCNVAWNSAANPQLLLFFSNLVCPVETEMKAKVSGKFGTGQCDGWKSNAKASIITTSVTVEGKLYMIAVHNVSMDKKTSDHLLELVLADMKYCEDELGITYIAWCTDDGGDARGMRRRLKEVRPKLLTPPCWGHQVNLVVGEVLELEVACIGSIDEGLEVVKWLLTLAPPMRTLYLQQEETLIECAGSKRDAKERARRILAPIENPQFWKSLAESVSSSNLVKMLLEPLAIAAKCMQAPDAGLDQVLLMLGNLYRIYSSEDINSRVRNCIQRSLEKRWRAMERDIFILALYLNPYIRGSAFSTKNPLVKPISLYNIAKQLYTQFFDEEPDLDFHAAFFDYSRDSNEFSSAYMQLAEMKRLYEREVLIFAFILFNKRVDVVRVWETLDTGESNGRNGLVRLAIWLLSIIANSAGSERGFSKFGIFLTKLRNLLSIQKVRKMNTVDMDLKHKHEELGMVTDRVKRKFAHFSEEFIGEKNPNFGYDETESFGQLATQLIQDFADNQNIPVDDDEEHPPTRSPHSLVNYQLKNLFQFPENGSESLANGLGFYWQGGIKDLQEELEVYDLLMEDFDL
ncbi:ribonuclease H-like domain-containing protein [Mycena crocata]|nr:ribonuclease H-like domain-containing protein [Mycena crocata]